MTIYDFVGEDINEPIQSNPGVGDVRRLWHRAQMQRLKNQTLRAAGGKSLPYTLLYFVPGLTTYCANRGVTIITGYMSGCYLFRYRYNGELRVAHVGTHDTLTEWSDKAKNAWKALVRKPGVSDVFGFDPLRDVSLELLMEGKKIGNPQVAGIWEGNGGARIAVVGNPAGIGGRKVLVGVESAPMRPWASIQHDPKML